MAAHFNNSGRKPFSIEKAAPAPVQKAGGMGGGTIALLARELKDDDALVEQLYLTFYSRLPNPKERTQATQYLGKDSARRRQR